MTEKYFRPKFRSREATVLIGALLLILLIAFLSLRAWTTFSRQSAQLDPTLEILSGFNALLAGLTDAETSQRGFLLTGDDHYLEPYLRARRNIGALLRNLEPVTVRRPDQSERLARLKPLIQQKLDELEQTIQLRRSAGPDSALAVVKTDRGKALMDQIRALGGEAEKVASGRRERFLEQARSSTNQLGLVATVGAGSLFALLFGAMVAIQRGTHRRQALIAELQEADVRLRESRDWLHTTLHSIGDGVIATDAAGRVTFMNGVAQSLTGWVWPQADGKPLADLFVISNEETGAPVANPVDRALKEGRIVGLANHTKLTSRDGRAIPIDDSAAPIRDAEGRVTGVVLVFRDVSERKKAEVELRKSEDRLRTLLDAIPVGVLAGDLHGRVLEANDALLEMIGYSREEVLSGALDWTAITPPEFLEADQRGIAEAQEKSRCTPYEKEYIHKNGKRIPIYVGLTLLGDAREDSVAFVLDLRAKKETERRLNEQLQVTKTITDNATSSLFMLDADQRCVFLNPSAQQLTGYTLDEARGSRLHDLVHHTRPDGTPYPIGECPIERALLEGIPARGEEVYVRRDGGFFPVRYTTSPIKSGEHRLGAVLEVRDTSAEKAAQLALTESEARFRQLAESMPQVVWTATADGVWDYVNTRWTELTGYNLADTQAGLFRNDMIAEDREAADRAALQGLTEGAAYEVECRLPCRAEGNLRWHLVRCVPVKDAAGKVARWFCTATDLHDRKLAEEQARLRLAELEALFDATPAFVWITRDANCQVIEGNRLANELFGVASHTNVSASSDSVSLPLRQCKPDGSEYLPEELPMQRAAASGETLYKAEVEFRFPDGRCVQTIGNASPLFDSANRVRGAVAVFLDITDEKQTQQALRRANEDLRQFAYAASHDLQEPLRMVSSYSQLLMKGHEREPGEEARLCVRFIREGVDRMRTLLDDLLSYTQMGETNQRPQEPVDLNLILENTMANLETAIRENHAIVTADALPVVQGYPAHFLQLLQNLIGNSIKYKSEQDPRIHVSAVPSEGGWEIAVADNGIGIDPAYHSAIFGVFRRLHGRSIPGTGIGLAICQRVVESNGGRIWVESEPGRGAVVHFTLRAVKDPTHDNAEFSHFAG